MIGTAIRAGLRVFDVPTPACTVGTVIVETEFLSTDVTPTVRPGKDPLSG
jgi:hypothetical protein